MECGCSFVEIESEKLTVMALNCILDIKNRRQQEISKVVEKYREQISNSWWFKIFKNRRPHTDQEIIKYIHRIYSNKYGPIWGNPLIEWECYHSDDERVALKLLTAAKHADKVMVSVNDLARIT